MSGSGVAEDLPQPEVRFADTVNSSKPAVVGVAIKRIPSAWVSSKLFQVRRDQFSDPLTGFVTNNAPVTQKHFPVS